MSDEPRQGELDQRSTLILAKLASGIPLAPDLIASLAAPWDDIGREMLAPGTRRPVDSFLSRIQQFPDWDLLARRVFSVRPDTSLEELDLEQGIAWKTWLDLAATVGEVEWEWRGWLPRAMVTMLAGEPAAGKSQLALAIAACFVRGDDWPDGTPFTGTLGSVVWCEAEAAQQINVDRARRWGLDLSRIIVPLPDVLSDVMLDIDEHRNKVAEAAYSPDVRLIIVDSLSGTNRGDENSADAMNVVKWLAELARNSGKPILLTHHLRKRGMLDVGNRLSLDRLRGFSGIPQQARVVWGMDTPDADFPDQKRLAVIKVNIGAPAEMIGVYVGENKPTFGSVPEPPRQPTVLDRAVDLLVALLQEQPLAFPEIEEQFTQAGISRASMQRAKEKLNVVSVRKVDDNGKTFWTWSLPARQTA